MAIRGIAEYFEKIRERAAGERAPEPEADAPACSTCRGIDFVVSSGIPLSDPGFGKAVPCPECDPAPQKAVADRRLERLLQSLPEKYREYSWDTTLDHPDLDMKQQQLYSGIITRVRNWGLEGYREKPWLVLSGGLGIGKTRLAVQSLMDLGKVGMPCEFIKVPELLSKLRQGFKDWSTDSLIEKYKNVEVLLLDDLGAENQTDWASETLFKIFDYRHDSRRLTIVTINVSATELPRRVADRLFDRKQSLVVLGNFPSFRSGIRWPDNGRRFSPATNQRGHGKTS